MRLREVGLQLGFRTDPELHLPSAAKQSDIKEQSRLEKTNRLCFIILFNRYAHV